MGVPSVMNPHQEGTQPIFMQPGFNPQLLFVSGRKCKQVSEVKIADSSQNPQLPRHPVKNRKKKQKKKKQIWLCLVL